MMRRIKAKNEKAVEGAIVGKETIEDTPIDEMPIVDEVPSVVTEFSGDNNAPQVDEVSEDNSTVVEEPISTEASIYDGVATRQSLTTAW